MREIVALEPLNAQSSPIHHLRPHQSLMMESERFMVRRKERTQDAQACLRAALRTRPARAGSVSGSILGLRGRIDGGAGKTSDVHAQHAQA